MPATPPVTAPSVPVTAPAVVSAQHPMPPAPDGQKFTFTVPAVSGAGGMGVGSLLVYLLMGGPNSIIPKGEDESCHCQEEIAAAVSKGAEIGDFDEHVDDFEELEAAFDTLERSVERLVWKYENGVRSHNPPFSEEEPR